VSVTGIVRGEPVAPGAETVIAAVWVPAPRPASATEAVIVLPFLDRLSHGASSVAVHSSVPPPVLATVSVFGSGDVPPSTPPNARLAGVTDSSGPGGGGSMVSVTGTIRGEPEAPAALIVTFAL
jgi:hypothetical protein